MSKNKNGESEYNDKFKQLAERKIEKSGYTFLKGFYYYLLTNMRYTTAWDYTYKVIRFLDSERINEVSEITLDDYVKHLADLKDTSSSNRITSYAAIKKFSKYLFANRICPEDYMRFVDRPKPVETPEQIEARQKNILSKEDYRKAINKIESGYDVNWRKARDKAILSVFMGTGIRLAALYKLDISNFDFKEGTMSVAEKGGVYRKVYCPKHVLTLVKEWFAYRDELAAKGETAAFVSERKTRITMAAIANVVKKYTGKSPHKSRAGFITETYAKSGDIYLAQKAANHASPKTTELYIRGKDQANAKKVAKIMEDFFED